jgi:serine carboxypeptidase-like clade 2
LEFGTDFNSEGDFYWSHGLISNPTYELLSAVCNTSQLWRERLGASLSASCLEVVDQLNAEIPDAIDKYDVTANVRLSSGESETLLGVHNHPLSPRFQSFSSDQSLQDALSQPVRSLGHGNSSITITALLIIGFCFPLCRNLERILIFV